MRLPQNFRYPHSLHVEMQLGIVFETFWIVGVQWIIWRKTSNEGVEELMLAESESGGCVVDGEGGIVLEEAGFDERKAVDIFVLVIRIVGRTLRTNK